MAQAVRERFSCARSGREKAARDSRLIRVSVSRWNRTMGRIVTRGVFGNAVGMRVCAR